MIDSLGELTIASKEFTYFGMVVLNDLGFDKGSQGPCSGDMILQAMISF